MLIFVETKCGAIRAGKHVEPYLTTKFEDIIDIVFSEFEKVQKPFLFARKLYRGLHGYIPQVDYVVEAGTFSQAIKLVETLENDRNDLHKCSATITGQCNPKCQGCKNFHKIMFGWDEE